jgi:two-component system sensor histidine kinase/response regulator
MRDEAERLALDGVLLKPVTRSMLVDSLVTLFAPTVDELAAAGAATATLPSLSGARLLLVEDNEINQQIAIELLESAGAKVTVADNGRIAVELLAAADDDAFDVVLMDLQMPEMDGHEATARIRANPRHGGLPIVAMTAHATLEERQRCFAEGMVDHVAKPVDPEQLIRTVARHFAGGAAANPTTKTNATQSTVASLELGEVPGLDSADGLRRLGGNVGLYRKLLMKLTTEQHDAATRIADQLGAGDREGAARRAHTLKGVAGNLGAKDVQAAAAALEAVLTRKNVDAGEAALIARLATCLAALMGPLSAALAAGEPSPAPSGPVDPAHAAAAIAQLRTQLGEFDSAAADTLDQNRDAIASVLGADTTTRIADALGRFAFDEALALLETPALPSEAP